ncbi:MAG: S-layer homology domain-containing protein [Bacillota bacterium]|nr:S-layer homology domain-containing protein [Bacillota bacterium]
MLNLTRKLKHNKILIILVLAVIFTPMNAFAQVDADTVELEDLLPKYNNFKWTYTGFAEYGHDMEINSIIVEEMSTRYMIEGSVHDMSDGEADSDFSINLEYILQSDVIIQNKDEEMMMDSKYDEIELLRTPLDEGSTWYQEVESDGVVTTLRSTITEVEDTDDGVIFTVRYEDINSDYYEQREIQSGVGVISFERIMIDGDTSYTMGYSINEEISGVDVEIDFQDVAQGQWFTDYVSKLVTMNLIDGYPDQTFRPNGEITVAEFIKVTVESLSYYPEGESEHWYDPYVSKAVELELIEEGEFEDFNRPINREEMTKIIINAIDEEPQSGQLEFSDTNEIDAEYLPYIYTAVELGIISGYPSDNSFRANQVSTRAEASKLFVILVEDMIETEAFTEEDAVALEAEFENRLFQETEEDSWVVLDFDNREDLVDYFAEIMDRELAESYVDDYYEYVDGELTLPPKDGPVMIIEDRDYELEMIHRRAYKLIQETETELYGHYTITITYHYENERWIIEDRDIEIH